MEKNYNEKVDIWSTGILFYNLLTGSQPYNDRHYVPLDEQIINRWLKRTKAGVKRRKSRTNCTKGLLLVFMAKKW